MKHVKHLFSVIRVLIMEVVSIDASPNQLSRLRNGHKVRVRRGGVHGCGLVVHPSHHAVMKRNFDKGKAVDVQLSPEELLANHQAAGEMSGGGIFAGGKMSLRPIQNLLKVAKKAGDTLGKPFEKTAQINPFTLGYDLGHDVIAPELKRLPGIKQAYNKDGTVKGGGRFGKNLLKTLAPHAEDLAIKVAKKEAERAITGGGKSLMRKIGRKQIRSVSKTLGKVAKEVIRDVLVPEGKESLRREMQHRRRRLDHDVQTPMAELIVDDAIDGKGLYAGARGGAIGPQVGSSLLRLDNPALRSQPYSANFSMNAQLPPQYVRGGVKFV
jgi:hypothetical protein